MAKSFLKGFTEGLGDQYTRKLEADEKRAQNADKWKYKEKEINAELENEKALKKIEDDKELATQAKKTRMLDPSTPMAEVLKLAAETGTDTKEIKNLREIREAELINRGDFNFIINRKNNFESAYREARPEATDDEINQAYNTEVVGKKTGTKTTVNIAPPTGEAFDAPSKDISDARTMADITEQATNHMVKIVGFLDEFPSITGFVGKLKGQASKLSNVFNEQGWDGLSSAAEGLGLNEEEFDAFTRFVSAGQQLNLIMASPLVKESRITDTERAMSEVITSVLGGTTSAKEAKIKIEELMDTVTETRYNAVRTLKTGKMLSEGNEAFYEARQPKEEAAPEAPAKPAGLPEDARQAADGDWYVERNGKFMKVIQ